jgi:hypothetical protein
LIHTLLGHVEPVACWSYDNAIWPVANSDLGDDSPGVKVHHGDAI